MRTIARLWAASPPLHPTTCFETFPCPRPTWLANAHATLDAAVLDAYGWPADLADAEILERLLALNLERAAV